MKFRLLFFFTKFSFFSLPPERKRKRVLPSCRNSEELNENVCWLLTNEEKHGSKKDAQTKGGRAASLIDSGQPFLLQYEIFHSDSS